MVFTFFPDLPTDVGEAEIISDQTPFHFSCSEYLVMQGKDEKRAFKIVYEGHCSPFREAIIINDLLLVGHEAHFYVYDLKAKYSLLILEMNGYFGHLYVDNSNFYVTDAQSLYRIDREKEVVWHCTNLGIDGVIIEQITENQIHGSGEWDPPGGWKDFVLDKKTGKSVTAYFS